MESKQATPKSAMERKGSIDSQEILRASLTGIPIGVSYCDCGKRIETCSLVYFHGMRETDGWTIFKTSCGECEEFSETLPENPGPADQALGACTVTEKFGVTTTRAVTILDTNASSQREEER